MPGSLPEQIGLEKQEASKKRLPQFRPGDTVRVSLRIKEGNNTRVQTFEGVCIERKSRGAGSHFTVRKISYGTGVEKVFPLYAPSIEKIEVIRMGRVRRAKLYYLRKLSGKKARITERKRQEKST